MEKIKKTWDSLKNRMKQLERKRACLLVGVSSTILVIGAVVGIHSIQVRMNTRQGNPVEISSEKKSTEGEKQSEEDPVRQIPCGYTGVIEGILSTKDLTNVYRAVGTSCEVVLVGQRIIKTETVSKLELGSRLIESFQKLDNQSWKLAETTSMSDRDYENLLAIVEAEAGGEDIEGKIMVANVILNRVKSSDFPENITSVIWDKRGGSTQFSPTADGRIYSVKISDLTREAVNRAIDGEDLSQGALYFIAPSGAEKENTEWFEKNLKFLFQHGGHRFYS